MLLVAFDTPTVTTVIAVGGWTSPADHIRNRSRHRRNTERKRLCVVYLGQKFRVGLFLRPRHKVSAPAVTCVRAFLESGFGRPRRRRNGQPTNLART